MGARRYFGLLLGLAALIAAAARAEIKDDEHLVFFETAAWLDANGSHWQVPIHAWIYEPADSRFRKAAIAKLLEQTYGLHTDPGNTPQFDRRVNLLLADNERGKRVQIQLGSVRLLLPPSSENGHIEAQLRLPRAEIDPFVVDGVLNFQTVAERARGRIFKGAIQLVAARGISVISDIDDTVKLSQVTDRARLMDNTFYQPFRAVPGMAALYQHWARAGARFHFVSSSPWQLYSPLHEFLTASGFPRASFELKHVRLKDRTMLNLFKPATKTKPIQIEALLRAYPRRKFVLVGDSGELDPEVYVRLMRDHPQQIVRILIRNVSGADRSDGRFRRVFADVDSQAWQLFSDVTTLSIELPTEGNR